MILRECLRMGGAHEKRLQTRVNKLYACTCPLFKMSFHSPHYERYDYLLKLGHVNSVQITLELDSVVLNPHSSDSLGVFKTPRSPGFIQRFRYWFGVQPGYYYFLKNSRVECNSSQIENQRARVKRTLLHNI